MKFGTESNPDRFSYIPLIGLFIMLAWGGAEIVEMVRRSWARYAAGAAAAMIVGVCGVLSYKQAGTWADNITLFVQAVVVNPYSVFARTHLATQLDRMDHWADAEIQSKNAIALDPTSAPARYNYAVLLDKHGRPKEAIEQYREAIRLNPSLPEPHNNLGLALARSGNLTEGIKQCEAAIKLRPDFSSAHINLGSLLLQQNKLDEAESQFKQATMSAELSDYELAGAHHNLAMVYYFKGKYAESWNQVHLCQKYGGELPPDYITSLSDKMTEPVQ